MPLDLDTAFGVHARALQLRSQRSQVLASNLANADTPHYKARDMDFSAVLGRHQGAGREVVRMASTHARHLRGSGGAEHGPLLYRNPYQPSLDNNTVETEVEQAAFARNAVQYEASLTFLNGKIRGLRQAISGRP